MPLNCGRSRSPRAFSYSRGSTRDAVPSAGAGVVSDLSATPAITLPCLTDTTLSAIGLSIVLTVETVFDVGALTPDVADQVPVAARHRAGAVQLARRVADHIVDDVVGEVFSVPATSPSASWRKCSAMMRSMASRVRLAAVGTVGSPSIRLPII